MISPRSKSLTTTLDEKNQFLHNSCLFEIHAVRVCVHTHTLSGSMCIPAAKVFFSYSYHMDRGCSHILPSHMHLGLTFLRDFTSSSKQYKRYWSYAKPPHNLGEAANNNISEHKEWVCGARHALEIPSMVKKALVTLTGLSAMDCGHWSAFLRKYFQPFQLILSDLRL